MYRPLQLPFFLPRTPSCHACPLPVCKISLSFRFRISLSDMTNYKSAFGKVCRIKNRQTFKSMPILNSAYHAVKYAELRIGILLKVCRFVIRHITTWYGMPELRIGILLKVCRFVIRHITQTDMETETELLRRHPLPPVDRILDTRLWKHGRKNGKKKNGGKNSVH